MILKKNTKTNLTITFVFNSNFKLNNLNLNTQLNFANKSKIYCKNFFIIIFLLKHYYNNTKNLKNTVNCFILPKKIKKFTILNAPFRDKISKKHFSLTRYSFIVKLTFSLVENLSFSEKSLIMFIEFFYKIKWFESNICSLHKITINFNFYYLN